MCLCHSLVYSCRISKRLIEKIVEYASTKGAIVYVEVMINTVAEYNNYIIKCPIELSGIRQKPIKNYRYRIMSKYGKLEWVHNDLPVIIQKNYMYHPVKPISLHKTWRTTLNL